MMHARRIFSAAVAFGALAASASPAIDVVGTWKGEVYFAQGRVHDIFVSKKLQRSADYRHGIHSAIVILRLHADKTFTAAALFPSGAVEPTAGTWSLSGPNLALTLAKAGGRPQDDLGPQVFIVQPGGRAMASTAGYGRMAGVVCRFVFKRVHTAGRSRIRIARVMRLEVAPRPAEAKPKNGEVRFVIRDVRVGGGPPGASGSKPPFGSGTWTGTFVIDGGDLKAEVSPAKVQAAEGVADMIAQTFNNGLVFNCDDGKTLILKVAGDRAAPKKGEVAQNARIVLKRGGGKTLTLSVVGDGGQPKVDKGWTFYTPYSTLRVADGEGQAKGSAGTLRISGLKFIVTGAADGEKNPTPPLPGNFIIRADDMKMTLVGPDGKPLGDGIRMLFENGGPALRASVRAAAPGEYRHGGVISSSAARGKVVIVYKDGTVEVFDPSDGSRKAYPPPD